METCRACLTIEEDLVPLDELFVNAYNLVTNLNVALLDAMPQYVCQACVQAVKFCVDFRERCTTAETTLQEILVQKIKSEDHKPIVNGLEDSKDICNMPIKFEVKAERNEDSFYGCNDDYDNFNDDIDYLFKNEAVEDIKPKRRKCKKKPKLTLKEKIDKLVTKLPCGLCKSSFMEKEDLSKHVEEHRNDRQCKLCCETVTTWPGLVAHRLTHIPNRKEHRCHVCNKMSFSQIHMEHHYMNVHFDGEKSKLTCKQCLRTYDTLRKLSKHISASHSKRCYICDYCNKAFNNKQPLTSHIKTHSDDKTYICDLCDFSSKLSGGLRDHKIRKHSPDKVSCKTCSRVFANSTDRDKHKCGNVGKICPVCGVQITKRYSQHLRTHSSEQQYKCTRCPAKFKTRGALKAHINRHDGIRPKQCEYCPLTFYTTSVLIKHRRVHTGEKPYVCKICHKGFTANHNLKVHMKVHGEHHLVVKRNKPENVLAFYNMPPPDQLT